MQMNHEAFSRSTSLRVSLKRGLARQAITTAARTAPDIAGLIRVAAELRPNAKAMERTAGRINGKPGVVRVAITKDRKGLTFITRAVREVEAQTEGETLFRETGLIYLRVRVGFTGAGVGFHLSAVSFCCHALERLVERSDIDLQSALLPRVDTEAQTIFRNWSRDALIEETGDEFYPAETPGLWAGGHDEMALDPDWSLVSPCGRLSIFSVRTFLSSAEMRPTVWLRWKGDPFCRMA